MKTQKIKKTIKNNNFRVLWTMVFIVGLIFQLSFNYLMASTAFFDNSAQSLNNVYKAGSLDLSLNTNDLGQIFLNQDFELHLGQAGNLPFQYQFKVETDDTDFCNNLILTATSSDALVFRNHLQNFVASSTIISDLFDSWQFKITSPANYPSEQTCNFKFIFQAWQSNQEKYDSLVGFSDEEIVVGSLENSSGSGGSECIQVSYPNGGEVWWVGRTHEIGWETNNPTGPNEDLKIDIYYSNDSGQSWGLIKTGVPNLGQYFWRVSLMLENNTYWVPSAKARIKLVARYSNGEICGVDTSDADYCPPIEYELLTPEELAWLKTHNLLEEPVNPITLDSDEPKEENVLPEEEIKNETRASVPSSETITALGEIDQMTLMAPPIETNIANEPLEFTPLTEADDVAEETLENIETVEDKELIQEATDTQQEEINLEATVPTTEAPICLNGENKDLKPIEEILEPTPTIGEPVVEALE